MFASLAHAFPLFSGTPSAHSATHGDVNCATNFFSYDRFDSESTDLSLYPLIHLFCVSTETILQTLR